MDLYKDNFAVLAQPGIAKPQTELPADYEQRLIKNDFVWASKTVTASWPNGVSVMTVSRKNNNFYLNL